MTNTQPLLRCVEVAGNRATASGDAKRSAVPIPGRNYNPAYGPIPAV